MKDLSIWRDISMMETQTAFPTLLGVLRVIRSREFCPVPLEDTE